MTLNAHRILLPLLVVAALVVLPSCSPPEENPDAGETDVDAGPDEPVDAGYDAGQQQSQDGGPAGDDCPSFLTNPVGAQCQTDGHVCRESGCFAPGPNCLFIECVCTGNSCSWVNQALLQPDAGPDAGMTPTDAGQGDAGQGDAGQDDAGQDDAGASDGGGDAG